MNQRERDALDQHITGNYGEDSVKEEVEESGRPPIDAPLSEHRRWFIETLERLRHIETKIGAVISAPNADKIAMADEALRLHESLVEAYIDGNKAERKTAEFILNEFEDIADDGNFIVEIEEYASRSSRENPCYRLIIHHGQKRILKLSGLSANAFNLAPHAVRNILGEGP